MAKYEINEEFENFSDVRQYSVEADEFQLENGYFYFFKEGEAVLTIVQKEVWTIGRKDADGNSPR